MTEPDTRPDPDTLLARIRTEAARAERAKLRIYLGYAPGVGKTFAMLSAARELRETGKEVVIGLVETHARYETAALVLGLEMLPATTRVCRSSRTSARFRSFRCAAALAARKLPSPWRSCKTSTTPPARTRPWLSDAAAADLFT